MDIDKFLQCIRKDKELPDGNLAWGHNFAPTVAYIEDKNLHLPMRCKWCDFIQDAWKPYENETPEEIREKYGFKLDDPYQSV
jgi:hypothetical protein